MWRIRGLFNWLATLHLTRSFGNATLSCVGSPSQGVGFLFPCELAFLGPGPFILDAKKYTQRGIPVKTHGTTST